MHGSAGAGLLALAVAQAPCRLRRAGDALLGRAAGAGCDQRPSEGQLVREIDDPHTGDRWLLLRNEQFPGGPGRLVLAGGSSQRVGRRSHRAGGERGSRSTVLPVIRAGDRLMVEEHTAVVDAVLEARALSPAALGAAFEVRLTIGGRVVRVVALGPGRAALQPEAGGAAMRQMRLLRAGFLLAADGAGGGAAGRCARQQERRRRGLRARRRRPRRP